MTVVRLTGCQDLLAGRPSGVPAGLADTGLAWLGDPYRDWASRHPGRQGCGYLCSGVPLELLHAAGLTPVRLLQLESVITQAAGWLPPFSCALAQATTERWIGGEFAFLRWIVFAHSCDTLKCVQDIWRLMGNGPQLLTFSLPVVVGTAASREYYLRELHSLARMLGAELGVDIGQDQLSRSIALYNEQRRLVDALQSRGSLPYSGRWALTLAGMVMPVDAHVDLLKRTLDRQEPATSAGKSRPRVVVTGTVLDDATIPGLLDELGFRVVGDDLCTGQRHYAGQVGESEEPWAALADHYAWRSPCPGRYYSEQSRSERLVAWIRSTHVDGVVLVQPKFCDPCAFDDIQVVKGLREAKVPYVVVETDATTPLGQLRTRLQAFSEMLMSPTGRIV